MISYPRTDGENQGRIYVTSDGTPVARVGSTRFARNSDKVSYIKYDGAKIITYAYEKRSFRDRENLRKEFNLNVRKNYAKNIAVSNKDDLLKAGISQKDIDKMEKTGSLPQGYQVHHVLSIDDNGTNDSANLILIRNASEHTAITASQNHFSRGMRAGEIKNVDFIVFDDDMVVYPLDNRPLTYHKHDDLD